MHRLSARRHSVRRGMISVEGCRGMHSFSCRQVKTRALGSRYTGEVDAMDGDVVCRHSFALSQQEQQFLAFVAHGDDVCLVDMLQIVQGKGEVEHGESFTSTCLALRSSSSSRAAISGSQSPMATVFPPCPSRRAGSMNIQSTGSISCRWRTLSAWQTEMWFRPRTGSCARLSGRGFPGARRKWHARSGRRDRRSR